MKLVHSGKVKDIYELDDKTLLFHFTDRISAYDVPMITDIKGKGEILCKFAQFWFNYLDFKNHMVRLDDKVKMVVKKLNMIPIEAVVRGYMYGSLYQRYKARRSTFGLEPDLKIASKLKEPLFDPSTKSEIHDKPISEDQILKGILTREELKIVKDTSISLYKQMSDLSDKAGLIIADVKFEFGKDPESDQITLADSLGPDEFRIWIKDSYRSGEEQESYDKQYLRDWLSKVGFKDKVENASKYDIKPIPPELPNEIVKELLQRYSIIYDKISRHYQ